MNEDIDLLDELDPLPRPKGIPYICIPKEKYKSLQRFHNEWVSVDDRLPAKDQIVLVICADSINDYSYPYTSDEAQDIAFYNNGKWWDESWPEGIKEDNILHEVTHWMLLPEPPMGESK